MSLYKKTFTAHIPPAPSPSTGLAARLRLTNAANSWGRFLVAPGYREPLACLGAGDKAF